MELIKISFPQWVKKYILTQPKHVLNRLMQKYFIRYKKKVNPDYYTPRSRYESEAIKICRNIVQKPDTLLEMNTNGERYATNDNFDIMYFIYDSSVDVIKNGISREIVVSPKTHSAILNIFDGHVKMRRDKKKEKIFSNLKSTLESIVLETSNGHFENAPIVKLSKKDKTLLCD